MVFVPFVVFYYERTKVMLTLTFKDIKKYVQDTFTDLMKEFNIEEGKYTIDIPNIVELINLKWRTCFQYSCETASELNDCLTNSIVDECFITSSCSHDNDGNVFFNIILPETHLFELLYHNLAAGDVSNSEILKFLNMSLRHELGHLMRAEREIKKYDSLGEFEYSEQIKYSQDYIDYCAYNMDLKKNNLPFREFIKQSAIRYYKITAEAEANEIANVDVEELIDTSFICWDRYKEMEI